MNGFTSRQKLINQAEQLVKQWTGQSLRQTSPRRIIGTFRNRARRLGYDSPQHYLRALRELEPTDDEPQRLVNLLTNGLTAFWRDAPQLSALRSLLNHLYDPGLSTEPIHIWCAGASTGEEPYTVAMIADEESVPVEVVGSDVNTEFLQTARRGIYSGWSLRRLPAQQRREYLRKINDDRWQIDHPCFSQVRFAHHNILAPPLRSNHPAGSWDLILCRNVLIYFSRSATGQALKNLTSVLAEHGYLMFGSSEQIHPERLGADAPQLRPVRRGEGFLYRPGRQRTGQTIDPGAGWVADEDSGLPSIPRADSSTSTDSEPQVSTLEEDTLPDNDTTGGDTVQTLADTAVEHLKDGDHEGALACLEAVLGYDPFHVESHCVMGAVFQSLGATEEALEAFQKALFLEPYQWFAAHRTAMIHEQMGNAAEARRFHRRTIRGLDELDDTGEDNRILRAAIGSMTRARQLARSSADEFFHLHGAES